MRKSFKFVSQQTSSTIDVPYSGSDPLPPIFGSSLCRSSKPLFLSNSLPDLAQTSWLLTSEDETLQESADQALSDVYDREIIAFYAQAVKEASAARLTLMDLSGTEDPG